MLRELLTAVSNPSVTFVAIPIAIRVLFLDASNYSCERLASEMAGRRISENQRDIRIFDKVPPVNVYFQGRR